MDFNGFHLHILHFPAIVIWLVVSTPLKNDHGKAAIVEDGNQP